MDLPTRTSRSTGKLSLTISRKLLGVGAGSQPLDAQGRTIWIVDANCGDGKHFIVRADEKLTAFLELERAIYEFAVDTIS